MQHPLYSSNCTQRIMPASSSLCNAFWRVLARFQRPFVLCEVPVASVHSPKEQARLILCEKGGTGWFSTQAACLLTRAGDASLVGKPSHYLLITVFQLWQLTPLQVAGGGAGGKSEAVMQLKGQLRVCVPPPPAPAARGLEDKWNGNK